MFLHNIINKLRGHKIISDFLTPQSFGQFRRYLITGFTSFGVEYTLFLILNEIVFVRVTPPFYSEINNLVFSLTNESMTMFTYNYQLSNTLVYIVIFWFNFLANRIWSFKSKQKLGKQLSIYSVLFILNLIIISSLFHLFSDVLGIMPRIAKVLIMGFVVCWNFIIYKKIIYK
ncbi:MAG: GtrA family protein [Clostridiaceae bacterium]|nr:GtrA family protein [Clostridiaceae bacterium]